MPLFRKKPVVIESVRFDGSNQREVLAFVYPTLSEDALHAAEVARLPVVIETLEGDMTASPGDFVIKGVQGEFYPCKPDIFEATYEAVPDRPSERLPHADVPGLTPETCPERDAHGSPFRFCPVKGCGWHEGMASDA